MARTRNVGLSGVAVTFASLAGWLVYAAVRDIDPVDGLGTLLAGNQPTPRSPGGTTGPGKGVGRGTFTGPDPTGPVPMSATVVVRPPDKGEGIRVHKSIAEPMTRLLADAYTAGFRDVGGGGWRSTAQQRTLRMLHGYTSDSQPSGSGGRLPVAVPGTSRHESGLAVDFNSNGRSLSRSDPFFQWLTANAATYGLRNLPSEPWHWSTDGH